MAQVTLSEITKVYPNGFTAVHPASFDIPDGEFVVLVGPSGCGKSTMLRMIAGLEDISQGDLNIGTRQVNNVDPADRDIAMVFQNYALYPHMSVRKNIGYGLKNRKIDKDEIDRKVREASTMLNLDDYLDRKPSQLSGGQRQRVAMGRAIVRDPALFLFDEPLSNLDAKLRTQMRIEIKALQRRLGVTAVYVTHDQVEAMTMADRIIVMNEGRIEQIGTPVDVYNTPETTFVASFMGAPPMNLMAGNIAGGKLRVGEEPIAYDNLPHSGDVTIGIRPEDIVPDERGDITIDVTLVEELGAHRLLHGTIAGQDISIHVDKDNMINTGALRVSLKPNAVSLFDAITGKRLT
ncbi:ABC transporter ATP-binding protein [Halocynthiibacter namhaensis]|uniref:ABC transporter ATP-binding protein n=1 Tax=Halocynthiibacter namhaensis TaxID=1290553 RepID=UPI0005797AB9|nr:sn-glycerol-3-phosphate ABC transporter ATP-binding protein UgpC [Halocynthiibacter namhaensis]